MAYTGTVSISYIFFIVEANQYGKYKSSPHLMNRQSWTRFQRQTDPTLKSRKTEAQVVLKHVYSGK